MTAALLLIAVAAGQLPVESGSGRAETGSGLFSLPWGARKPESGLTPNLTRRGGQPVPGSAPPESGSGRLSWEVGSRRGTPDDLALLREEFEAYFSGGAESGSSRTESGSELQAPSDSAARRQTAAELAALRARLDAEIERVEAELRDAERAAERAASRNPVAIPPPIPLPADAADADPARVRTLLVGFGWLAALAAGLLGGALLSGLGGRRRDPRPLENRRLDLAGEIAETADSLLAAADAEEAGRLAACRDRLRERAGRAAVFLDPGVAAAIRSLVAANEAGGRTAAYGRLIAALRSGVR